MTLVVVVTVLYLPGSVCDIAMIVAVYVPGFVLLTRRILVVLFPAPIVTGVVLKSAVSVVLVIIRS